MPREVEAEDAGLWWRGGAILGSSAISAMPKAVIRPLTYYIYIGIYTYYT
jgi:hypothetical protein